MFRSCQKHVQSPDRKNCHHSSIPGIQELERRDSYFFKDWTYPFRGWTIQSSGVQVRKHAYDEFMNAKVERDLTEKWGQSYGRR